MTKTKKKKAPRVRVQLALLPADYAQLEAVAKILKRSITGTVVHLAFEWRGPSA